MNLKKILSGFLAVAMAVTTMVTASVTAGAVAINKPDGNEVVVATFGLSQWDADTNTNITADEFTVAQYGGCWAGLYSGLPNDVFTNENYYIKVTFTTDEVLTWGSNNDPMGTVAGWEWSAYSGWLNAGKFYQGTVTAGEEGQNLVPANNSTDTAYYCYLPVSDFTAGEKIEGNVQSYLAGEATIKSVQLVQFSTIPAPELPENEYVFDTASGTADTWGNPAQTAVGAGKTITSAVLEGDFVVVAPYESNSLPKLTLSDGSGDGEPLNWIQVSPYVAIDGVAYFTKADVVTAWKAAGGSEKFAEVVMMFISCSDANELTVTGVKLYSSVAATTKHTITVTTPTNGTVTPDKTEAEAGEKITLDVTPAAGYEFGELNVKAGTESVTVDEEDYSFTMPDADVTVTATFTKIPEAGELTISETELTITDWKTADPTTLTASVEGDEAAVITWLSSDATIAEVDGGIVTFHKRGVVTITAKSGEGEQAQTAACVITVNEKDTSSPGKTILREVKVETDGSITYTENDVLTISATEAASAKSVTITVTDNNGKTWKRDVTECYRSVTYKAKGGAPETISGGSNFLIAVTVTGIPDGTTVTVTATVNPAD